TPDDAVNYSIVTASVPITVLKAAPAIAWSNPASLTYGAALSAAELNATASVRGTFSYSPSLGTVLAAGAGQSLTATFTPDDGANYSSAIATLVITVAKATPTITWPAPASIVYGTPLGASQLNATSSVPGTFAY